MQKETEMREQNVLSSALNSFVDLISISNLNKFL